MNLPDRVKLRSDFAKKLRDLNDKQIAVQQFIDLISQQGEHRVAALVAETRDTWDAIAKEYGLDVQNVNYALDKDGETIIPVNMRLTNG